MEKKFEKQTFSKRLKSMLQVDSRRMLTIPFFYIMIGISFVVPILILVMTTMMDGTVTVNPQTGLPSEPMQGFDNIWQILGAVSGGEASEGSAAMSMDLVSMCNIHMMYFAVCVLVCVFIGDDFRSGYAKNLFTVRAQKTDYVISKTVVCFVGGAGMLLAFFVGSMLGGAIAGLPFTMTGFDVGNLVASMLAKIFLVPIFVSIYALMSVIAKQKVWLSILLSFGVGMFLFNIAPMVAPLDAGVLNVLLSFVGGGLFSVGLGAISNVVLKKTSLV
ncbi:MAG: ABC transporter permease [Clostridia bacterium]|nr:ABC transporter permease [Clostridia bacterium]